MVDREITKLGHNKKSHPMRVAFCLINFLDGLTVHYLIEDGFESSSIVSGKVCQHFTVDF